MDVGTQLRASREAKRLSLEALARTTRVQLRVLAAIEQNDRSALPPRPFGRGFVRAYAREVGLDPEQTVRDYFGQFAPPQEVAEAPAPIRDVPRGVTRFSIPVRAIVLVAVAIVGGVFLVRSVSRPSHDTAAVGTSGTTAGADRTISPDTRHSVPAPVPAATAPKEDEPVRALDVVVTTTDRCWIAATADGQRVVYRLMGAGEKAAIRASNSLTILAGNAGAATWTINGRDRGTFGAPGAVQTFRVKLVAGKIVTSSVSQ